MALFSLNTEKQLVKQARKGDQASIKVLFEQYSGFLAAVCRRYIPDEDEAMDVLQEAFIKIFSSLSSFEYRGKGSLKAWMTRIVVNDSLKFLRDNKKFNKISLDEAAEYGQELTYNDAQEEEENDLLSSVSCAEIQRLIKELPDGFRTVFNLFVFENKSHKEIAALLGISESTSASQLHRAKARLAEQISCLK